MHPLKSAALILLTASAVLCTAPNASTKAHKPRFAHSAGDIKVVVPKKVTHDGKFVSHSLPHEYKRSYYAKRKIGAEDKVHYHVPIDNEVHHVELWPNHEMVSPGMVVETRKGDDEVAFRKGTDVSCHYQGRIKGHGKRRSAVSTCEGLRGVLRTRRGSYIIEPSVHHERVGGAEHPHIVYHIADEDEPNCGTSDDAVHALAKRGLREGIARAANPLRSARSSSNVTKSGGAVNDGRLYLETLLVLDRTLIDFHGATDVENYALTVVNMAYTLYHEDSLDIRVTPIVVRIVRLEDDEKDMAVVINPNYSVNPIFRHAPGEQMNTKISPNARATLDHFCAWQLKMNPGDDNHPNHHDVALLITRVDICADESNCGLLGLARMAGACDPIAACALAEDNGLKLGYVVAHELAHTLGVDHDVKSGSEGCEGRLADGFTTVMNPAISMKTEEWTKCSSEDLKAFLLSGFGKCLSDEPADHAFNMQDMLPGVMYGGDYQCRSLISQQAVECEMGLTCDSLNCEVPGYGCMETHVMPALGTSCGEKKWCYQRRCLEVGERPGAVDGGWGAWGSWGACSRTCGSGVAVSERDCNNPTPSRLGKYCVGERKRHRVCAAQPCEPGTMSFRDEQCAEFNDWVYPEDGHTHTWTAHYMHDENQCSLFCKNERDSVAMLKPKVVDGTSCMRGHRDVCIGGTCREVPCDMNLESHAVEDVCGICHGDGTECIVKDGTQTFEQDPSAGLKKLVEVPQGARNIHVEELEPTHALIVVSGEDQQEPYAKGDKLGMFDVPGSSAWLGMTHLRQESLHIPGPITKPLVIFVRPVEGVTLSYSMALRRDKKRCVGGCYSWDFVSWSPCSAQCGPGSEVAVPRCIERQGGLVEDVYCKHVERPDEKNRPCFLQPCVARWMVGDWQKDCKDCKPGDTSCSRTRSVVCMRPAGEGEGETDLVADNLCKALGAKPHDMELCPMATAASHVAARAPSREATAGVPNNNNLIAIIRQTKEDIVTDFLFSPEAMRNGCEDADKHTTKKCVATSERPACSKEKEEKADRNKECGQNADEDVDDDDDVDDEGIDDDDDDKDDGVSCVHGPLKADRLQKMCHLKHGAHARRGKRQCDLATTTSTTAKPLKVKINRGQTVVDTVDLADFHLSFSAGRDGNPRNASLPPCVSGMEALKLIGRLQAADRKEQEKARDEHAKHDKRDVGAVADNAADVQRQRQELKREEDRLEQKIADEPQLGKAFYKRAADDEHQVSLLDIELDSERDDDLKKIEDFDELTLDRRSDMALDGDSFFDAEPVSDARVDSLDTENLGVGELGTQAIVAAVLEDTEKHNRGQFDDLLTSDKSNDAKGQSSASPQKAIYRPANANTLVGQIPLPKVSKPMGVDLSVQPPSPWTGQHASVEAVVATQMHASRHGASPTAQASLPQPIGRYAARLPTYRMEPPSNAGHVYLNPYELHNREEKLVPASNQAFSAQQPAEEDPAAGPLPKQTYLGGHKVTQLAQLHQERRPMAFNPGYNSKLASPNRISSPVAESQFVQGKSPSVLQTAESYFAPRRDALRQDARYMDLEQGNSRLTQGNRLEYGPMTRNEYLQVKGTPSLQRDSVQPSFGNQEYEQRTRPLSQESSFEPRQNAVQRERFENFEDSRPEVTLGQLQRARSAHEEYIQAHSGSNPQSGVLQNFGYPWEGNAELAANQGLTNSAEASEEVPRSDYDLDSEKGNEIQHEQTKDLLDAIYKDLNPLLQREYPEQSVSSNDHPSYDRFTNLYKDFDSINLMTADSTRPKQVHKIPSSKQAGKTMEDQPNMNWPLAARYPTPQGRVNAPVAHNSMQQPNRPKYPLVDAFIMEQTATNSLENHAPGSPYQSKGSQPVIPEPAPIVRNSGEAGLDLARKYDFRPSHRGQPNLGGPNKASFPQSQQVNFDIHTLLSSNDRQEHKEPMNSQVKQEVNNLIPKSHLRNNNYDSAIKESEAVKKMSNRPAEQTLKLKVTPEITKELGVSEPHGTPMQLTEKSSLNQKQEVVHQASGSQRESMQEVSSLLHKPDDPREALMGQPHKSDAREEFRKVFSQELGKQPLALISGQGMSHKWKEKASELGAKHEVGQGKPDNELKEDAKQHLQQAAMITPSPAEYLENKLKEELNERIRQAAMESAISASKQELKETSLKPNVREEKKYDSTQALKTDSKNELQQELNEQKLKSDANQVLKQEPTNQPSKPEPAKDSSDPLLELDPYRGYADISEKALKRMQEHMSRMNKHQRATQDLGRDDSEQREGALYFGDLPQRELDIIEAMGAIHKDHDEPASLSNVGVGIEEQLHDMFDVDVETDQRSWKDVAIVGADEEPKSDLKFIEKRESGTDNDVSQQTGGYSENSEERGNLIENIEVGSHDDYPLSSDGDDIPQSGSNIQRVSRDDSQQIREDQNAERQEQERSRTDDLSSSGGNPLSGSSSGMEGGDGGEKEVRYLTNERRRRRARSTHRCEDRPHKVHAHVRKGETVNDSEEPADVKLTFVDDSDEDLLSGKVFPTVQVEGKKALKLMDEMQKKARTKAPAQVKEAHGAQCWR